MIRAEIEAEGLRRLSARLTGLLALAGKEGDHETDRRWWQRRLHARAVEQVKGIRSKHLGLYAREEERLGVGTEEGQEELRRLHHYTWRRSPTAGRVGGRVFRTVSVRSPASSWWYPPRVTTRTRQWVTKGGAVHSRTVTTAHPARDMKPGLLKGRAHMVIPIDRLAKRYTPASPPRLYASWTN